MGPTKKVKKSWKGFFVKKQEWAFLVSSIGLYSGQFARLLANGSSCQEESARRISCPGEEEQGRRVAGGAPTKKAQPKEVQQQQRQESQEEAQEGEGVEENAEVQEGEELALDPESVDMGNPLTPAEEEVKASVSFVNRKKKGGHGDCFVFKYKLPWGPQTKLNYSKWYASQEAASRAIFQWAQQHWR